MALISSFIASSLPRITFNLLSNQSLSNAAIIDYDNILLLGHGS